MNKKSTKQAFTLSEVLITLAIIGVVAVLTIPALMQNIDQRKYNAAAGNFERKLGEAINVMHAQDRLSGYESTIDL